MMNKVVYILVPLMLMSVVFCTCNSGLGFWVVTWLQLDSVYKQFGKTGVLHQSSDWLGWSSSKWFVECVVKYCYYYSGHTWCSSSLWTNAV